MARPCVHPHVYGGCRFCCLLVGLSVWLRDRVGESFSAVVTGRGRGASIVMVSDPAVITSLRDDSLKLGSEITVKLLGVDEERRRLNFVSAS